MYVTTADFKYRNNFPTLDNVSIQDGIDYVNDTFPGIFKLFSGLPSEQRINKLTRLENLMIAWYLADINPKSVSGIVANGFPVTSKTIGGTKGASLTFRQVDVQPGMEFLNTNTFGNMALMMFMGSPERFGIYPGASVGMSRGQGGGGPM